MIGKSDFVLKLGKMLLGVVAGGILLIAAAAVYFCVTPKPSGIPILEYHMVNSVYQGESKDLAVPVEDFEAQMDYLQSEGYTTITLLEFMKAKKAGASGKADYSDV